MSDAAQPPKEPEMDIHKPHAAKSWKEFFIELGTIVAGILIALALEQCVETFREHRRAAEARAHIRAEIANDLRLFNIRAATESCIAKRLDEVSALIATSAAGKLSQEPIWIGNPEAYAILDSRYKAATQSGAFSLFDDQEQAAYARFYGFFATYFQLEMDEQKAWADLRILEDRPPSSAALDTTLRSALKQARLNRHQIQRIRTQLLITAKDVDLAPIQGRYIPKSVCLPLHTPRAVALETIMSSRFDKGTYDEP